MFKYNKSLGIIPARFGSSRFPGKPLVDIDGKMMVRRVYEQARKSSLSEVVVATDDERIFNAVRAFGGQVVMTSPSHPSGTDRCVEVVKMNRFKGYDLIVNIQGDEPYIQPEQIDLALGGLSEPEGLRIATLAKRIEDAGQLFSPDTVKVVFSKDFRAMYFSRSPVPYLRGVDRKEWAGTGDFYKHIGLYVFRKSALLAISEMAAGKLEHAESLEQLRWLENGLDIHVVLTETETGSVDTPEDLKKLNGK